ncbi:MAG: ABC transporter substrate-binding protein [Deltaproteobacteria bacterium]|nr:ABC transporter substrate-binding protein [Candidatus Anaeroferrophillus wilburensis]MBN2888156.1 ABC transporter substrate-binding protein [Deltaproteobacteria bacterium]
MTNRSLKVKQLVACGLAAVLILFAAIAGATDQSSPQAQLKAAIDSLVEVLKDESLKGEGQKPLLEEKITKLFKQQFDMAYTSQLCLGRYWRTISEKEKQEFITLFTDLLKSTYIGKIETYNDEVVRYDDEKLLENKALVKTVIVSKGTEIPLDYKMVNRGGIWLVYDVIIEEVSLVSNYRSQFSSILQKGKFPELLDRIRNKIAENQADRDQAKGQQLG